jgi:hypothetical protein
MHKRRRAGSLLPALYLVVAAVVAVAVMPSVLRPPPEQQQSSSALSPNAPPDEEAETILQSLKQAASRTAGATGNQQDAAPATTTSTIVKPARGQCFGNPPRQTESAYSPPCRAAFTGDNGGGTAPGVTGTTVTVAFWHALGMPAHRGKIEDTPPPDEDAPYRTARVLQRYFNDRYELYGRRLQLFAIEDDPVNEANARASAVKVATEANAFAAITLETPFCDEFARRGRICFDGNGEQKSFYADREPYIWSYQMNTDDVDRMSAEYICKKLVGRNADFAGGFELGKPRKIAVIQDSWPGNDFRSYTRITEPAKEMCGFETDQHYDYNGADPQQMSSMMAQIRSSGVTTIVGSTGLSDGAVLMGAAQAANFNPEWVFLNSYGIDFNDSARLLPAGQIEHYFGMSGWELPQPEEDTDCFRAYKSVDPAGTPDSNFCRLLYISIEHVVNGIQEAGPALDGESFRTGMYAMPLQTRRTDYAIGGGYAPGDHSFVDDLDEIWWDPSCVDPDGGEPGCFQHTAGGKRYRPGQMDSEIRVFEREGSVSGFSR